MFETIDDPEDTLRVPGWLWNLCVRLYRSRDPIKRAAATGLIVNRSIPREAGEELFDRIQRGYLGWARSLSANDLEDLERAICAQACYMQEWLARLVRDRFPEAELVAFACAREILEAAACALQWNNRYGWVREDLERLDKDVSAALVAYSDPANEPERPIFIRRTEPLLHLARERSSIHVMCWWGILADPASPHP